MFKVEILSPQKSLFSGEVDGVVLPGKEGELGVLEGHAPFLSTLAKGTVRIKAAGSEREFATCGGFVEVNEKGVTLLVGQ